MSSASVTSSKQESPSGSAELVQELEAARRLVKTLQEYLENLRVFRKSLKDVNDNCEQLKKVNVQWIDIANTFKKKIHLETYQNLNVGGLDLHFLDSFQRL